MARHGIRELDRSQLQRIEHSIATIERQKPAEQLRLGCLLDALRREHAVLVGARRAGHMPAAAAGLSAVQQTRH